MLKWNKIEDWKELKKLRIAAMCVIKMIKRNTSNKCFCNIL